MLLDLIYNNPLWLVASLVVLVPVALACGMVALSQRVLPRELRLEHNEMTGYIISVVGISYAVLIAFVAVAVWGSYDKAGAMANKEADLTGNLYRDASGLGQPTAALVRKQLRQYADTVVEEEWPAMARGEYPRAGWEPLEGIQDVLAEYRPAHQAQAIYMQETLRVLNELYDARRERLAASEGGVEPVVWIIVLLGTGLTIGYTFFFGMPSLRMHMAMTSGVTAATMLVLVLIIAFDWPFRGEVQVQPTMFQRVLQNMDALDRR